MGAELNLPEDVLELLKSGFLNIGHAKVILSLPTPELQAEAARIIAGQASGEDRRPPAVAA